MFVCCALLYVHSSFAIIWGRGGGLVALLLMSCGCVVAIGVLWLFLAVPWVGLQYVIVLFPDHTHLLFAQYYKDLAVPKYKGYDNVFMKLCNLRCDQNRIGLSNSRINSHSVNLKLKR